MSNPTDITPASSAGPSLPDAELGVATFLATEPSVAAPSPPAEAFRAGASIATTSELLGPLAELVGDWVGSGFSLIALPDFKVKPFRLQVNSTTEHFRFAAIAGPIPNRGSRQPDLIYGGVTYLQHVSDTPTHAGLHVEPGLMLNVPPTTVPKQGHTVIRQASIPHGNSLLAQGEPLIVSGGPEISPVSSLPTGPGVDDAYTAPYRTGPFPPGFDAINPNASLLKAIAGQHILRTVVLPFSSAGAGGIVNMPFIVQNANAVQLDAIFWIETVQRAGGGTFLQLQYTQTIILDFEGIRWPHITVATLIKQ